MSTCPYCGAETRPGDNFCLNCGNRLTSANSSPQQAQNVVGESTIPESDNWMQPQSPQSPAMGSAPPASGSTWSDLTVANTSIEPAQHSGEMAPTQAATIDKIANPARFVLRSENGTVLQEFPLEKQEIAIGRAPNSDILLSKDKLTSRRHATVQYENGQYVLRDERSANGTFVNGQQLEEMSPRVLQDGDHVGIGEHELIFHGYSSAPAVEDMPTMAVQFNPVSAEATFRTREAAVHEDEDAGVPLHDEFSTRSMDNGSSAALEKAVQAEAVPASEVAQSQEPTIQAPLPPVPAPQAQAPAPLPVPAPVPTAPAAEQSSSYTGSTSDANVTFNRLTSLSEPSLPDIAPLMAALSALDGQVMSLQEQLNSTQEAMRNHETEIAQTTNQLRSGVRRVSDRMDNTIADVARTREALAWTELLQLMEDVMNNPRDIEYVTKLARKARELNKVFQMHQNVLNTLAECNSLLRSLIGDER
ncbi:MAG TPA: FHA domain-containing protein [Ktedonobacteraceae bacterium]|nr:FHA domain-containing protein [Ktedonobacteraceae bacterium]